MTLPVEVTVVMKEECALLVRSPEFRRSPVMTQLLEFLVDFCIARDSRGPKAYTVAVEGLGRHPSFDPNIDSYPRVQVGRLRKMITAYYALHPRSRQIQIPVGHYKVEIAHYGDRANLLGNAQSSIFTAGYADNLPNAMGFQQKPGLFWVVLLVGAGLALGALGNLTLSTG